MAILVGVKASAADCGSFITGMGGDQILLFTIYDKDEADDLSPNERKVLKQFLDVELKARTS